MSSEQLNAYLAVNSYLGSATGVTLVDYKTCKEIASGSFQAGQYPHLQRWHSHVSHLLTAYPKFDRLGNEIPAGKAPNLGSAPPAPKTGAAPKEAAPKKDASPKKEAAPKKESKKEAAPKSEGKKKNQKKDDKKEEAKEEDPEEARKKQLKKVIKEGGKRGVEIEGAADMGGLQFFCTSVDEVGGDLEMIVESVKAMNNDPVPGDEERKGCSGHIGKMIFSAGADQLAVAAYVPEAKHGELECEEWLSSVLALFKGEVLIKDKTLSTGRVKTDGDNNIFPLKIREPMILEANNFLRKKGLFPEDKDSDDDEMVFGDDDFPS